MNYKRKLNILNILIKIAIKLDNKIYKLALEIYYSKINNKEELNLKHKNYYNRSI